MELADTGYNASPDVIDYQTEAPCQGPVPSLEVVGQGREHPIDHHSKYRLLPLFSHQDLKGRPYH